MRSAPSKPNSTADPLSFPFFATAHYSTKQLITLLPLLPDYLRAKLQSRFPPLIIRILPPNGRSSFCPPTPCPAASSLALAAREEKKESGRIMALSLAKTRVCRRRRPSCDGCPTICCGAKRRPLKSAPSPSPPFSSSPRLRIHPSIHPSIHPPSPFHFPSLH